MAGRFTKKSLSVSMIVGTVLVPLSAFAAIWLTDPGQAEAEALTTTLATAPEPSVDTTAATVVVSDPRADLLKACGPEGMQLVVLEEDGSITEVQQAALDALRELCDQEGMALPDKPPLEANVRTVIVPATAPTTAPTTTSSTQAGDDDQETRDHDDDQYEEKEDHEDDEYEHEDEHEDEHESEHETHAEDD